MRPCPQICTHDVSSPPQRHSRLCNSTPRVRAYLAFFREWIAHFSIILNNILKGFAARDRDRHIVVPVTLEKSAAIPHVRRSVRMTCPSIDNPMRFFSFAPCLFQVDRLYYTTLFARRNRHHVYDKWQITRVLLTKLQGQSVLYLGNSYNHIEVGMQSSSDASSKASPNVASFALQLPSTVEMNFPYSGTSRIRGPAPSLKETRRLLSRYRGVLCRIRRS